MATTTAGVRRRTRVRTLAPIATAAVAAMIALSGSAPVAAAPTVNSALPAYGTIWVINGGDDTTGGYITEFAPTAKGNVAPIATIAGDKTEMSGPNAIAVTPTGALWVAQASGEAITEYAPGAKGNVKPIQALTGAKTKLDIPIAIALAPDGSMWVIDNGVTPAILHFAKGAHGNVAPLARVAGSNAAFSSMRGIAVAPNNKHVWVERTNDGGKDAAVMEFTSKANGNVAPVRTITGDKTKLGAFPYGVIINPAGQIIVASDNNGLGENAILTYAASAHGNAAPIREVTGEKTQVTQPSFLALDAVGNIWSENYSDGEVYEHSPTADGNVAPKRLIAGAKTQVLYPSGVAIFAKAPTAPRKLQVAAKAHHHVALTWQAPSDNGGGIVSYTAYVKKTEHGAWRKLGTATKPSLTKKLAVTKTYKFAITATNTAGTSKRSTSASR